MQAEFNRGLSRCPRVRRALPGTLQASATCTTGGTCGSICTGQDRVCRLGTPSAAPLLSRIPVPQYARSQED